MNETTKNELRKSVEAAREDYKDAFRKAAAAQGEHALAVSQRNNAMAKLDALIADAIELGVDVGANPNGGSVDPFARTTKPPF